MEPQIVPHIILEKVKADFLKRLNLVIEVQDRVSVLGTDVVLGWRNNEQFKYVAQHVSDMSKIMSEYSVVDKLSENIVDELEKQMFTYIPQKKFGRFLLKVMKRFNW